MAQQDNRNFVESIIDAQKQTMDAVVENTKKFTAGNAAINDPVEKTTQWYKNWLENQKSFFSKTAEKAENMTGNIQQNMSQMNEFFQNWYNTQTNWAKQIWEMNTSFLQNAGTGQHTANMNPMNLMQEWQNNWNNWMKGMNNMNQWGNMMQQWGNMFSMDAFKKSNENWNSLMNQYQEILNTNWAKLQENLQNGTAQDAYKNMVNATEGFTKFYEMWAPMWKSIQDKTFNLEVFKQWTNPEVYKDLMDKYLGLMPESNRNYLNQMTGMMRDGFKQMNQAFSQNYQQMKSMMGTMMPDMNASGFFGNMLSGYNQFSGMMNDAAAPFTKMMTPNQQTKTMMEWQDIANRMAVYNIKNSELQYMMYQQGLKVMENLAENIIDKIQNGEETSSMMALYQEWMNLSDKTYVALFESDEYSKLMAEVSAMQLKLKKDIELQAEKFMAGIPVATRSEVDELYRTIYDLKKQVRQLEKMMELDTEEEIPSATEEAKSTASRRTVTKK